MIFEKEIIRISFGGDLMCLREETDAVFKKFGKLHYDDYVAGLKPLFADSDFTVANLETPIASSFPLSNQSVRFNSPVEFLGALKDVGFDFLATANNHCLDRGVVGADETIRQLDSFGIAHDGTFLSKDESERVYVAEIGGGLKLAVISCTFGTNSQINGEMLAQGEEWRVALLKKQNKLRKLPVSDDVSNGNFRTYIADEVSLAAINNSDNLLYMNRMMDKVREAKRQADLVVVMPHVGGQYNPGPAGYAKWVVEQFRKAGTDIIIAGHSHTPHRAEMRDGCLICYSLGNLCFTPGVGFYVPNVLSEYGIVLHVYINVTLKKVARCTFDIVKNVVDENGCAHVVPVVGLYEAGGLSAAAKDRLQMDNEAVVNRFSGRAGDVPMSYEYELDISH